MQGGCRIQDEAGEEGNGRSGPGEELAAENGRVQGLIPALTAQASGPTCFHQASAPPTASHAATVPISRIPGGKFNLILRAMPHHPQPLGGRPPAALPCPR